ncbi:regulatory protein, arsR family [Halogranum amylolyticum]|uniref:Regulatory protein, arsR family n=1 Tax=Halogranum amylolyticum TaxID=660520 RepID=A0A1H8PWH3_9EURY|nr:ArsR family transcriptional regulator [Halogranum amylolyticum]SEO45873.1 regulatory protein, arsR family [Halogranum amylolyticum]
MSRFIRRITLLVVVGILVSTPTAVATTAAQPTTTPSDVTAKHAAAQATATADAASLPETIDASLSETPFGPDRPRTAVGGELPERLTQFVQETPLEIAVPELLMAAGVNRRSESTTLENDTRKALYETVRESPGTYLSELASEFGLSVSTVRYHARILENDHAVTIVESSGKHRLYPVDGTDPTLSAALDEESTARIIYGIDRLGPVTVAELAAELGLADSTVSHHLKRLDDDGLVTRERRGREVLTELTPTVETAVGTDDDTLESAD